MASFGIHVAIGKKYIEKNNIENPIEFYKGIITTDLAIDKKKTHHTGLYEKGNLEDSLINKVHLYDYIVSTKVDTDFERGVFIHLVTDYLFYNHFFDKEYVSHVPYTEFCNNLCFSYMQTDDLLKQEFNLNYFDLENEVEENIRRNKENRDVLGPERKNILPMDKLHKFIDYVASIDLEKYKEKILTNGKNVLP